MYSENILKKMINKKNSVRIKIEQNKLIDAFNIGQIDLLIRKPALICYFCKLTLSYQ